MTDLRVSFGSAYEAATASFYKITQACHNLVKISMYGPRIMLKHVASEKLEIICVNNVEYKTFDQVLWLCDRLKPLKSLLIQGAASSLELAMPHPNKVSATALRQAYREAALKIRDQTNVFFPNLTELHASFGDCYAFSFYAPSIKDLRLTTSNRKIVHTELTHIDMCENWDYGLTKFRFQLDDNHYVHVLNNSYFRCLNLESITLNVVWEEVEPTWHLPIEKLSKLKILCVAYKFNGSGNTDFGEISLPANLHQCCPLLETIEIDNGLIGKETLLAIFQCSNLKKLELTQCGSNTPEEPRIDFELPPMVLATKIKHLALYGFHTISGSIFSRLLQSCQQLEHFRLLFFQEKIPKLLANLKEYANPMNFKVFYTEWFVDFDENELIAMCQMLRRFKRLAIFETEHNLLPCGESELEQKLTQLVPKRVSVSVDSK